MNIGSVTRDNTLQALQSIGATGDSDATSATGSTTASEDASQVQLSKPGELFKKLAELQQTDPAKFKETVQKIADSLKTEAQGADPADSQQLNKLADAFSQAAQSGDMSSLKPAHHHHHAAAAGGASAGAQRAYGGDQASRPEPRADHAGSVRFGAIDRGRRALGHRH